MWERELGLFLECHKRSVHSFSLVLVHFVVFCFGGWEKCIGVLGGRFGVCWLNGGIER